MRDQDNLVSLTTELELTVEQTESFIKGYTERGRFGYISTLKNHDAYMKGANQRMEDERIIRDNAINVPLPDDTDVTSSETD